jgi:ribosome-binding protein aMBF1 (putative translation factor)
MSIYLDKSKILLTVKTSNMLDVAKLKNESDNFDAIRFAKWLREKRESAGLSMTALANKSGISKQRISQLEGADKALQTELRPNLR